jgi:hypothetical protein
VELLPPVFWFQQIIEPNPYSKGGETDLSSQRNCKVKLHRVEDVEKAGI